MFRFEGPKSLFDICTTTCLKDLSSFCDVNESKLPDKIKESVALPKEICESFLTKHRELHPDGLNDNFINLFKDSTKTRLERVDISNSSITDEGFKSIFNHKIIDFNFEGCSNLTETSFMTLKQCGQHLVKLNVGSSSVIFPLDDDDMDFKVAAAENNYILYTPKLQFFRVHNLEPFTERYFRFLLKPMTNLQFLDLSGCGHLGKLDAIRDMPRLTTLILYNVHHAELAVHSICAVKTLTHLDISQSSIKDLEYYKPNTLLRSISTSLPRLEYLDISGTNLAGAGVAELLDEIDVTPEGLEELKKTDIPGLANRVNNPLKFLGLLDTSNDACHRRDIPATHITGSASETQVLLAVSVYLNRPVFLKKSLTELFRIFRYEMCVDQKCALTLILKSMDKHLTDKHIQISGSASLFYIVKGPIGSFLNPFLRKKIITTLLNAMCEHKFETTMIRNSCLTLCHFKIPQDVLFEYERLVGILLYILLEIEHYGFVERIAIYLLNSLACQVDGHQKRLVGDLGAIQTMLKVIQDRLARNLCDDVMEIAWSAMWNVTDETPINCERFLDGSGMHFFLRCLQEFPTKEELLRNIMGLLGNVAEVESLRPRLMKEEYLTVFSSLLDNQSDGIEVSYNAAGILSHIASDGPELWQKMNIASPSREAILGRLTSAVSRWDIKATRNINYRSFQPIYRLIASRSCPEAQYWAVWALANLSFLYPNKYCELIEEEGGIVCLQENVLENEKSFECTKQLAQAVLKSVAKFHEPTWMIAGQPYIMPRDEEQAS